MERAKCRSRAEAKAARETRYFNGKPCKHGHVYDRYTSSGACIKCSASNSRAWHKNNPEKAKEKHRKHRDKNADRYKKWRNDHLRSRYRKDANFKAKCLLRRALRRAKDSGLNGGKAQSLKDIGYSAEEFVAHIEALWEHGMHWGNHGEWHIDHIKPVAAFFAEGEIDPAIVNALENLRPVWAEHNLKKGSKVGA